MCGPSRIKITVLSLLLKAMSRIKDQVSSPVCRRYAYSYIHSENCGRLTRSPAAILRCTCERTLLRVLKQAGGGGGGGGNLDDGNGRKKIYREPYRFLKFAD